MSLKKDVLGLKQFGVFPLFSPSAGINKELMEKEEI